MTEAMPYILVGWLCLVLGFTMGAVWCGFFRQTKDEYDEIERQMAEGEDAL